MAHHQQGENRRSAVQAVMNMLKVPSTSNMPSIDEDEAVGDADEPPDDHELFKRRPCSRASDSGRAYFDSLYHNDRRESLLTRALMTSPEQSPDTGVFPSIGHFPRRTPTASSHSNVSVPSTAELTSDGGMTSPERSNPPSPPAPMTHFQTGTKKAQPQPVVIADESRSHFPAPTSNNEPTLEANLGRKRCITFACGKKVAEQKAEAQKKEAEEPKPVQSIEQPKRKCALTFACPTRTMPKPETKNLENSKPFTRRQPSPAPILSRKSSDESHSSRKSSGSEAIDAKDLDKSEKTRFHEFAVDHNEEDEWVNEATEEKPRITVNDCMKKEMVIRKIGEEAEEEARQDEEDEEDEDGTAVDDDETGFSSDDGNESDNEEGFAESDDESDAGSEYHFWAPSTTTAATSTEHLEHIRHPLNRNVSETSLDSIHGDNRVPIFQAPSGLSKKRGSTLPKFRPGTPDLPDSTDFVCGTLDEDRPLEVAYISCMEERKRSKHVFIPQDIDPSFPTTDPEEEEDEVDEYVEDDDGEPSWLKDDMEDIDDSISTRGRRRSTDHTIKLSSYSPTRRHDPTPKPCATRRSSPPPKRIRSPGPPTKRLRSPAPQNRAKSPAPIHRHAIAISPSRQAHALRITGQNRGCELVQAKSLPRTPNPFFARQLKKTKGGASFDTISPKSSGITRRTSHARGAIDIVEGLEKKRQKRKEKFWRQHCRKAAKQEMERKPIPGKGMERMKELGLEVAERTKGYGLGQQAQLVLSI